MNNLSNIINLKNTRVLALFILTIFFNVSVSAQATANIVLKDKIETNSSSILEQSQSSPAINFIFWFMGSKQDPNKVILNEEYNKKKQIMISGSAPNHLLIKTFFKKAVNFESLIA